MAAVAHLGFYLLLHHLRNQQVNLTKTGLLYSLEVLKKKNSASLSAHVVNHLLRKNRKTIPKFLSGKKLFKNVTLQILNFIPIS